MSTTTFKTPHKAHKKTPKKGNTTHTDSVTGKSWTISNNSGISLVIINAYKENEDDAVDLYEQTLQTLTTDDGKKSIADGSTAVVSIADDQLIDNLIIAKASNLAPVKVLDAPIADQTSVTVTADDLANARQAETFQQTIVAFPSSDLAKAYAAALSNDDISTVEDFFKNQQGYEQVTIDMVVAYQTYYNRFPFAYAAYKADQTYYLYATDGTKNTYEGSLKITNSNTSPVDTDSALGKFQATFTDSDGLNDTDLYYASGQFVDDLNTDAPAICLAGTFMQRSQFTKIDTDKDLMPTFSGTVNGKDVLVYDKKIEKNKEGFFQDLDALFHPETTTDIIELVGIIVGAIAGIVILAVVIRKCISARRKSNLTPEEIAAKRTKMTEEYRAKTQSILDRMGKKLKIPDDVNASLDGIKKTASDMLAKDSQRKMQDTIAKQQELVNTIEGYHDGDDLQEARDNMEYVYEIVQGANANDLISQTPNLISKLKDATGILNDIYKNIQKKASADDKQAMSDARARIDELSRAIDKNEDIKEDLDNDTVPDLDIIE